MAILGDFEVTIHSNETQAVEYENDDNVEMNIPKDPSGSNVITKYVEVVSGAFFEFHFDIGHPLRTLKDNAIAFHVFVDGKFAVNRIISKERLKVHPLKSFIVVGAKDVENDQPVLRRFQFSDLAIRQMDEGDQVHKLHDKYADLGTLKVKVWRTVETGRGNHRNTNLKDLSAVPEKAIKGRAVDVSTRYISTPIKHIGDVIYTRKLDDAPIASFLFKYRTRRALQSLLLIEPDPLPVPLEQRRIEELDREEMMTLLQRQKEQLRLHDEKKPLKRELSPGIDDQINTIQRIKGSQGQDIYVLDSDDEDGIEVVEQPPKAVPTEVVQI